MPLIRLPVRLPARLHARFVFAAASLLTATPSWAGGSGMPWEQPLQQVLESVQGPVAKISGFWVNGVTGAVERKGQKSLSTEGDFFARDTLTDDEREEFARLGEACTPV